MSENLKISKRCEKRWRFILLKLFAHVYVMLVNKF